MVRTIPLAMLALQPAPQTDSVWECTLPRAVHCGPDGCTEQGARLSLLIDPDYSEYRRCFAEYRGRCEVHRAAFSERDGYLVIQAAPLPLFATLAPDLSIVEASAQRGAVATFRGTCRVGPPPIRTERVRDR